MPPKKNSPNGFMLFTFDWKAKYGKHMSLREATTESGRLWANMNAQERAPYNEKAKNEKIGGKGKMEKLTCTGVPVSAVENEKLDLERRERQMKRNIETAVRNSVKNCELELHSYYFIMVNYFTKTLKGGVYVPAEISVAEYSLKEGVSCKYHSFINPGVTIYGHQYEAQHHSDTTHKLPLPPKAKGETNLGSIYNDVLNFIRNKETGEYPPIYTNRDSVPIVESVLEFLKADVGANQIDLNIYSIQYLFYIMKEATCEVGEIDKPKSFYITDAYFERDFFEYQTGIACEYHEEVDKSKYCTQSCVTRWGFMFSDYMCRDIAISLKPGRHVPVATNLAAIINPGGSSFNDTDSYISMGSESSYATKPISEHKHYYDDQRTQISDAHFSRHYKTSDYPSLGSRSHAKKSSSTLPAQPSKTKKLSHHGEFKSYGSDNDESNADLNPWSSRSRNVPRRPDSSHFSLEQEHERGDRDRRRDDNLSDYDEFNSVASLGRGRGFINRSLNTTSGSGHGQMFRP